jgi:hypothetical protein
MSTEPNELDEIVERYKNLSARDRHELDEFLERYENLTSAQREQLRVRLEKHRTNENRGEATRTLFDAFNDHGMIGSITDVPEDWSTNPKYMEGFGQDAG